MTAQFMLIATEKLVGNPRNARNMQLPDEQQALTALKQSIAKAGFQGDPLVVVALTDDVVKEYFNGERPDGDYMLLSGHRRATAMMELLQKAAEEATEKPGEAALAKIARYDHIPCVVKEGSYRELVLGAVVANQNRQNVDLVSKALAAEQIRIMVAKDKVAQIAAKAKWKAEKKEEEIEKINARHTAGDLVKDAELAAIMGQSVPTVARFRVVLGFPEELKTAFASGVLKEANVSDVAAAIKKGVFVATIMAAIQACGKDATYKKLAAAIQALYAPKPEGAAAGQQAGEGGGTEGAATGADPEKVKAAAALNSYLEIEKGVKAASGKDMGVAIGGDALDKLISALLGRLPKAAREQLLPVTTIMKGATLTTTVDGMRTVLNVLDIADDGEGSEEGAAGIDDSEIGGEE